MAYGTVRYGTVRYGTVRYGTCLVLLPILFLLLLHPSPFSYSSCSFRSFANPGLQAAASAADLLELDDSMAR